MKAHHQGLEVEAVGADDDDLAVDDEVRAVDSTDSGHQLREVPAEGPVIAAADVDVVAVTEGDRPEPVPLRFEDVVATLRQLALQPGEHRRHGWADRQGHPGDLPGPGPAVSV